jgi:hypothetical protein
MDIKPKGFSVIEIDGYVTEAAVRQTRQVLNDLKLREEMVNRNYEIARRFFGYSVLRQRLRSLLNECIACTPGYISDNLLFY